MRLFTTADCKSCEETKKYIKPEMKVKIIQLKKVNDEWVDDENTKFPFQDRGFPILEVGIDNTKQPHYLIGKEGIIQFFTKGFVSIANSDYCPFEKGKCKEKDCVRFTVLFKGLVPEGACVDYWAPILQTELIQNIKNLR